MGVVKLSTAGIVNYEKYSNFRAGIPLPPTGSFDLLETQVLASSAASVTFSSLDTLAAGYQHLQIRGVMRTARTGASNEAVFMRFNGISTSSYSNHNIGGDGSSVISSSFSNPVTFLRPLIVTANDATANAFTPFVIDLLDPFETTKYTTSRAFYGYAANINRVALESGAFLSTDAINSITISGQVDNIAQLSRFSLYGIKTGA